MENNVQDEGMVVWVVCDAICSVQCTKHLNALNEQVLKPFSYKFVAMYFDDILVYSVDMVTTLEYLRMVIEVLRRNKLYINLKKCCSLYSNVEGFYSWC